MYAGCVVGGPGLPASGGAAASVFMDAFLNGSAEDSPSLATGLADKLRRASAEADGFVPSSRSTFTLATEARLLAEEAALSRMEMGRFAAWLHDAYSPEVAQQFTLGVSEGLAYSHPVNVQSNVGGGRPAENRSPVGGGQYASGSPGSGGNGSAQPSLDNGTTPGRHPLYGKERCPASSR